MRRARARSRDRRVVAMVMSFCRIGRAHRGLRGRSTRRRGGPVLHRACGRSAAEDGGPRLSCLARNAGEAGRGRKAAGPPLPGPGGLPSDRPSRRPGCGSPPIRRATRRPTTKRLRRARAHPVAAMAELRKRTTSCGTSCWRTDARSLPYAQPAEILVEVVEAGRQA